MWHMSFSKCFSPPQKKRGGGGTSNKTNKKKTHEGPLQIQIRSSTTYDLLLSVQCSHCLRSEAYGGHANSLQRSAIHFSAQPHKPIVPGRQAWPPLSLSFALSFSLFDNEVENAWTCGSRAVEGASTISPSVHAFFCVLFLIVSWNLDQRSSGANTAIQWLLCLPVYLSVVVYISIFSACLSSVFDLASVIAYRPLPCLSVCPSFATWYCIKPRKVHKTNRKTSPQKICIRTAGRTCKEAASLLRSAGQRDGKSPRQTDRQRRRTTYSRITLHQTHKWYLGCFYLLSTAASLPLVWSASRCEMLQSWLQSYSHE